MIAAEWLRAPEAALVGERLGPSLAAGLGRSSGMFRTPGAIAAQLFPFHDERRARGWVPARAGPMLALFAGQLDNAAEIAGELGLPEPGHDDARALAQLYGQAVLRWHDQADRRLIGEYSAILIDEAARRLRLSRSPLRAPPLHYHADAARVIAATVPRAIFACGVEQRLNERKLADNAWFNFSAEEESWFEGLRRVPLGTIVELTPGGEQARRFYDIASLPSVRRASPADYLAEAHHLFEEATRACLKGSSKPAIMLSGGLDSAQVALKALDVLPPGTPLDAFTFVVEPGWDGSEYRGQYGNERPVVEAFCAQHPRIVPHYFDNAAAGFDTRAQDLFFATGMAPVNMANLSVYHAMWQAAAAQGCDRVLIGELGNLTFSAPGHWAFSEYLRTFRWGQLRRALRGALGDDRPVWRNFITYALMPLLPDRLWQWQHRLRQRTNLYALASPLRADYAASSGAVARASAAGAATLRLPQPDRLTDLLPLQNETWGEFCDIYNGFEQLYGITQRDPTAWRPFFEFCVGLPSDMFLRDGQDRWLAREMGRGRMPEAQRLERRRGRHNADWHVKLSRQRAGLLAELDRLERIPRLARMLDFAKVRAGLEDWPASGAIPDEARLVREGAIPRAFLLARYINYVEGRNLG